MLPARIGDLAALMGRYRRRVAPRSRSSSPRRASGSRSWTVRSARAVLAGRSARAEADLVRASTDGGMQRAAATGTVFLVGAGPGDPDLLTLRALQVLQDADIVFYDELVTDAVLDRARRDAKRVFVGKRRGEPGIGQDEINRRLIEAAHAGQRVVRLKGGDAFVFGRGGEELEAPARGQHLRSSIVPGITAALGCAAEAELPLTFRNEATRLSLRHRASRRRGRSGRLVRPRRPADHASWSIWASPPPPRCATA